MRRRRPRRTATTTKTSATVAITATTGSTITIATTSTRTRTRTTTPPPSRIHRSCGAGASFRRRQSCVLPRSRHECGSGPPPPVLERAGAPGLCEAPRERKAHARGGDREGGEGDRRRKGDERLPGGE